MTEADRPFFATAAKGTEGVLRDELRELRMPKVRADRGGVHFGGELEHGMRACLRSRIALRVLKRVATFYAPDPEALYEGAASVDWSEYLDAKLTLAVNASVKNGQLRHSNFVAQKVKDAIVDQLRTRSGARPDVEKREPDVQIAIHIAKDQAQLYVDLSGTPLSRRGYRTEAGEAPMREPLAAAMLRLAGFTPGTPLLDPLCGSGTLPIEAAMWAAGLPAGGKRAFGFQRWLCFDDSARETWNVELERAQRFANPVETSITGRDRDPEAIRVAVANARRAGVSPVLEEADLFRAEPPEPGTLVVINPPYGVRLEQEHGWLTEFGRALRAMRGCTVAVITPERELMQAVGTKPVSEHTLYNGDLECRLFCWKPR